MQILESDSELLLGVVLDHRGVVQKLDNLVVSGDIVSELEAITRDWCYYSHVHRALNLDTN